MKILLIQLASTDHVEQNITRVTRMIEQAVSTERPNLIMLPEMWSCLGGSMRNKIEAAEYLPERSSFYNLQDKGKTAGRLYHFLAKIACTYNVYVHGGSIGERSTENPDKLYNTTLVFNPQGIEIGRYRKIHLFDVSTPSGETYQESTLYKNGIHPALCAIGPYKWGLSICYDLRFPDLFAHYQKHGAECIAVPAAFTYETGKAHWECLLRARAIDTQCWIIACSTTGTHYSINGEERQTYGHSMVIDPWGRICAFLDQREGWFTAVLDSNVTQWARTLIPLA